MKENKALTNLNKIVSSKPSKWIEKAKQREANSEWINKSVKIAIHILHEIEALKSSQSMSQRVLAKRLGVSPQYVNKILKGQENLSLETICKIEKALNITLVQIPYFKASHGTFISDEQYVFPKNLARQVYNKKPEPVTYTSYNQSESEEIPA